MMDGIQLCINNPHVIIIFILKKLKKIQIVCDALSIIRPTQKRIYDFTF